MIDLREIKKSTLVFYAYILNQTLLNETPKQAFTIQANLTPINPLTTPNPTKTHKYETIH